MQTHSRFRFLHDRLTPAARTVVPVLALALTVTAAFAQESKQSETPLDDAAAFELLRRMAREDTLGVPEIDYIYGSWVDVESQRPTLEDILGWCIENEKKRFQNLDEAMFRRRLRTIMLFNPEDPDGEYELHEEVTQVYVQPPDKVIEVRLGQREFKSKEEETDSNVGAEIESSNSALSDLPFFFEKLDEYAFEIVERRFLGDRILYRIEFQPRSEFAALPEGNFLIDTGDYQILRAEYQWTENVPYPAFLKAVDKVVIQRRKSGDTWFVESVDVAVALRSIPFMGIPKRIEMEMRVEDMQINPEPAIPDSVWSLGD